MAQYQLCYIPRPSRAGPPWGTWHCSTQCVVCYVVCCIVCSVLCSVQASGAASYHRAATQPLSQSPLCQYHHSLPAPPAPPHTSAGAEFGNLQIVALFQSLKGGREERLGFGGTAAVTHLFCSGGRRESAAAAAVGTTAAVGTAAAVELEGGAVDARGLGAHTPPRARQCRM